MLKFTSFNYQEECRRCGYRFFLNVGFDENGICNFYPNGEPFEMENMTLGIFGRRKRIICPKCKKRLKMKRAIKVIKRC